MPTPQARADAINNFAAQVHELGSGVTKVADALTRDRKTRAIWTAIILVALIASLITNGYAVATARGNRERTTDIKTSLGILQAATSPQAQANQNRALGAAVQALDQRTRDAINEYLAIEAASKGQSPPPTLAPATPYVPPTTSTTRPSQAPTTTAGRSSGPSTTTRTTTTTTPASTTTTAAPPTTQPSTTTAAPPTTQPSTTTTRCSLGVSGRCVLR